MCEGSITAGFLIVTSFFWTHQEQSIRVGWWYLMNGTGMPVVARSHSRLHLSPLTLSAQILAAFVSFGVLHIPKNSLAPWQWYMIITGVLTIILSIFFW